MATPAKHLKIGLVLDSGLDKPDGVQQYVLAIGEWLRGQGHDVHYLVGQTEREDIQGLHSLSRSVKVRFNGNDGSIPLYASKSKLKAFLAAEHFDVLHVQVPHHPLLAQRIILAADSRTAVVGTFHIAPYSKLVTVANKALGIWLKPSLKRFDRMVSVSTAAADFAKQTFGITTEVLPNVIDYKRFHKAKPLPEYDDDIFTILFLGRLVPRKGCQLLLEAIVLLSRRLDLPKFRVLVCGRGPLEAKLRRFAGERGLNDIVSFVGFVSEDDKPRYYASADISVFPSSGGESFGIVLLEAMAGGKAVVLAGDNSGYHSVMAPRPDLLFDAESASTLAKKLGYYMQNQPQRRSMQTWGAGYSKEFDVKTVGAKLLNIYYETLRKRRGA
ncbi:MAG TPA: glycosyltransferase family 4 protein [Candidatus Dormibacteraeota bacterium]|nr:glycosyltransferase family 4 protein [Candidatus Dormibacteraeota bacterium]